jgi:hypothetical protein
MNVIQLTRQATPEAKAKLLSELKAAYADEENATILKVSVGEKEIEAVLIPDHPAFSQIFKKIAGAKNTMRSEFKWSDHELEAAVGLGVIQVNLSKVSILLVDFAEDNVIFAIVEKAFYEANK